MGRSCIKTPVRQTTREALVDRLDSFETVVEIGIGRRPDVAAGLAAAGVEVTATDVHERAVPAGVAFRQDDVTRPQESIYADADCLYALNLPPELHRPARDLARAVDAALYFTTLGGDGPAVPVTRETLPGETLFRAKPERAFTSGTSSRQR
jgi:hypothetical protein